MTSWIAIVVSGLLLAGLLYWLLVTTEGVFLGRRVVVWLYDVTAHKYDDIKEFDDEAERFFVIRPLRHHLRHLPNPLILDVAAGTGRLSHYLLNEPDFHGRVAGLDPSARMIGYAAAKLAAFGWRGMLVQQTAVPLPFAANTFDAVTCLESLEFFPSDAAALAEMARVLKPGGILMVTRRRGRDGRAFLKRYRNVSQFEQMLRDLGFTAVNTQPWQIDYDQVFGRKVTKVESD